MKAVHEGSVHWHLLMRDEDRPNIAGKKELCSAFRKESYNWDSQWKGRQDLCIVSLPNGKEKWKWGGGSVVKHL